LSKRLFGGSVGGQRGDQPGSTSGLEQALLVLVVGLARIGATARGGLAVTEIQDELLLGGGAALS